MRKMSDSLPCQPDVGQVIRRAAFDNWPGLRRLLRWVCLPAGDRRLLLEAGICSVGARLGLSLLPFRRLAELSRSVTTNRRLARDRLSLDRFIWAIGVASGHVPNATCLSRSLALQALLARYGQQAELRIGVARQSGDRLDAHAWVELDGRVLLGGAEVARYTRLWVGESVTAQEETPCLSL